MRAVGTIVNEGAGRIAWRLFAGFVGGYALISAMVAAMGSALPAIGVPRGEAVSLALLLALFVYVPVCLLMFATRRPWRDGLVLFAGASVLAATAAMI
jgi:hypothetical protein